MLADVGASAVLVGHSERRHVIKEPDALIHQKTLAGLAQGHTVVLCVGETLEQRERSETDRINESQVRSALAGLDAAGLKDKLVIAYEPVWAIGTGKTATPADAQDAHHKIRSVMRSMFGPGVADATRILYGGSVKADNAKELFAGPDVDGGLIGGAALSASGFAAIVRAAAG
jgi:triosephosphate isomerase